jgi:hypothetical protein
LLEYRIMRVNMPFMSAVYSSEPSLMRSNPATSAQILGRLAAYIISLSLIPAYRG